MEDADYLKYTCERGPQYIDGIYPYTAKFREDRIKFNPTVRDQRYFIVKTILKDFPWNKQIQVIDFGCCKLNFFRYLKEIESVETILEIDRNKDILQVYRQVAVPLDYVVDYVNRPLKVVVMAGNIADKDIRTLNTDAVVCIEVIEHLEPDELEMLPSNIFGYIKPTLAIFTTPNVEFNPLFPKMEDKFRVPDHKFEWTRNEFEKWARDIVGMYPEYDVKFYGIGPGPEGTADKFLCCSQMAVFTRIKRDNDDNANETAEQQHQQRQQVLSSDAGGVVYEEIARRVFEWESKFESRVTSLRRDLLFRIGNMKERCRYSHEPYISRTLASLLWPAHIFCNDIREMELVKIVMQSEYAGWLKQGTNEDNESFYYFDFPGNVNNLL